LCLLQSFVCPYNDKGVQMSAFINRFEICLGDFFTTEFAGSDIFTQSRKICHVVQTS